MKIKEVEDLVGITKANIRYYEKEGLLNPKRNEENNYREYTLEDVRSLELTPNQFNRNIAVMFTADMRIHLALFHASALILTPFVISLYGFVQMLLNSSEMPVQTMGRMQMLVFWAMLLVYVGCFLFGPKVGRIFKGYPYCRSFCRLYGSHDSFVWIGVGKMAVCGCRIFCIYAIYRDGLEGCVCGRKNFNRYYAISTGCRIINICGAFFPFSVSLQNN